MSRLHRLARENKQTADELAQEVLKPGAIAKARKAQAPPKPVRCTRTLDGESGVKLTAEEIADWLSLIPGDATIRPVMTFSNPDYARLSIYSSPDIMSGLEATWYEDGLS